MRFRIDIIKKKGLLAAMAFSAGMLWIGGGGAASATAAEGQQTVKDAAAAPGEQETVKPVEPAFAGQQELLYKDSGDVITVVGKNIHTVEYSSSNKDVAVVSTAGVVSGVDEGNTVITAEVQYDEGGESKTKKLSYELKVIDNFTNYFDILNGDVKKLTEKGKALKEMHIPDYCNYIQVKSAKWENILFGNSAVEKIFLSDYMEQFCSGGIKNSADGPRNLREVYFGKSLREFGNLNGAYALEKFAVHPENGDYSVKEDVLFSQKSLMCYPAAKKDVSYTVPEDVEYIGWYGFAGTKNLAKITLPKGLKSIGENAFANTGLTEISIPADTKLGENVFADCGKLQKVLLPDEIDEWTTIFKGCPVLKTVVVPNTARSVTSRCFVDCPGLMEFQMSPGTSDFQVEDGVLLKRSTRELAAYPMGRKDSGYTVPKGIKSIGIGGFYGALYLKNITLDDALTEINLDAFSNCRALEKIRIPRRVKSIQYHSIWDESGMFWGCTSLKEITVDSRNNYFSSSKGVLYNKSGKTLYRYPLAKKGSKFTVPKKVTTIKNSSFAQARNLQKIVMGNHVKTIEQRAFMGGKILKSVVLPSKLKKINSSAFENCKKLTKVVLPDKVATVNRRLFAHCTGLKEVVLGKSVKNITYRAFYDCGNLRKITFGGKKWLGMSYDSNTDGKDDPFYLAGSKKYSRLTVHIPKCTKSQKKKCKKILLGNGLHKKAKLKFGKK